jgi:predicted PurR-regulated permease PerM
MAEVRGSLGRPVLYAIVALGVYLAYLVLRPFVAALVWAVIFAILFHRLQVRLTGKFSPNHAALITTLVVASAIVLPSVVLITLAAHQLPDVTGSLTLPSSTSQGAPAVPPAVRHAWDTVRAHSPVAMPEDPTEVLQKAGRRAVTFLAPRAGKLAGDFLASLGTLGAMLFAFFFMVRDGDRIDRELRDRLPFSAEESDRLITGTRDLVAASVGASLVVAAAQGLIGGLAFWLVRIPAPAFWGMVIGFCSLLPVVGAAIVWIPAAIGLLLSGAIGRGVLLLLLGVFGISMVDNILRPVLLTGKTSVSGFVVFFGLLGGAAAFGLVGLVVGPIVLVVTARLLDDLHRPDVLLES